MDQISNNQSSIETSNPETPLTSPTNNPSAPANLTPPPPRKSSMLPILLTFLITSILFVGGYIGYQQFISKSTISPVSAPLPTSSTEAVAEADPTADWETHSGKYITLKYPQEWQVTESFNEYFKDFITEITHQTKNVSIEITPIQQPYGWGGDAIITSTPITITIGSETYNSTETILDNKSVFFEQKVTVNNKDFYILAGSGYPVNDDQTTSITAYSQEKNTILQILSTFKFIDSSQTQEKQFGFIKSITKEDNTYSLSIDYAEMLSGDQAIQTLIDAGECDNADTCDLPNGYYISNENAKLRTFTIASNTKVQLSILSDNQALSLNEFTAILTSQKDDYRKTTPYWITIENNQITHIEEQYLP